MDTNSLFSMRPTGWDVKFWMRTKIDFASDKDTVEYIMRQDKNARMEVLMSCALAPPNLRWLALVEFFERASSDQEVSLVTRLIKDFVDEFPILASRELGNVTSERLKMAVKDTLPRTTQLNFPLTYREVDGTTLQLAGKEDLDQWVTELFRNGTFMPMGILTDAEGRYIKVFLRKPGQNVEFEPRYKYVRHGFQFLLAYGSQDDINW